MREDRRVWGRGRNEVGREGEKSSPPRTGAGRDSDLAANDRRPWFWSRLGAGDAAKNSALNVEGVGQRAFPSRQDFTDQNDFSIPLNKQSSTPQRLVKGERKQAFTEFSL